MAEQFRTTVSLVLWTDTTQQAEQAVGQIRAAVPPADQGSVLSTIEYVSQGRPAAMAPVPDGLLLADEEEARP